MRTNDEIISLIQEKVDEKGISMSELARRVGIAKSTMSRYFNKTREFPLNRANDFSRVLNITPEFLLGIQKEAIKETPEIVFIYNQLEQPRQEKVLSFANEQLEEQKHEQNNLFEVTGISYAAAASGLGRGFDVDDYDTYTVYTDEEPPRYDYAIGVRGDSMLPTYEAGDMLYLVDKGMSNYSGQLCVIAYNGQTYFKKVYTEANGLRLVSLNKKYDDIFIDYPPAEDTYIKIFDVIGSFVPVEM
ncbi:cI-like repressor [Streptococcus equi subsp. equi]|uniref:XRE family transcriptional regulator n=1 Tax=Streptococcus equi TaxID=1336 RepID=UPI000657BDD2|nr:XRE family transcriptional regulator [Streptococcus equi]CRS53047.1 cI-like repressor [Streptococcus equi subsp. equi]CRS54951.1 cI-like repressor [Streptococcus equi subsp. equi]CRS55546.1 cI-like repressor [Streptococcus equi subsp. equi]CRS56278.1 cI-like repressor [Streptococcus equi subsp. equi]CRS84588.1 cI-like repressor [Streptococcus equi subsp. equi]